MEKVVFLQTLHVATNFVCEPFATILSVFLFLMFTSRKARVLPTLFVLDSITICSPTGAALRNLGNKKQYQLSNSYILQLILIIKKKTKKMAREHT